MAKNINECRYVRPVRVHHMDACCNCVGRPNRVLGDSY